MKELGPRSAALLDAHDEIELNLAIEAGLIAADARRSGGRTDATDAELAQLQGLGEQAWERFLAANVRLVAMIAGRAARRSGLCQSELFQEGFTGMIHALQRFDHRRGARFATYALPWIRAYVSRAVAQGCGAVDLPSSQAQQRRRVKATWRRLGDELRRDPTPVEVADALDIPVGTVSALLAHEPPVALAHDDGLVVDVVDEHAQDGFEEVLSRLAPINNWLEQIGTVEATVVELRFGFRGEPLGLPEIARRLDRPVSTVRRAQERALRRLRGLCSTGYSPLVA